ncbi:L-ascorbate peroxidase S, chloroplastic/mitochondrial-like isoform X3 [Durio zibethinus]|uniref:L-ascorbate peroxidase n=1 Tax=Durio zibethinus TaxID=66656 RepID=A0A6P6B7Y0_DURZI|nr:L-ascorbate peroxidase S, chloroplastic/mitochondrial-like isoform X3 [Durio zibethinus]
MASSLGTAAVSRILASSSSSSDGARLSLRSSSSSSSPSPSILSFSYSLKSLAFSPLSSHFSRHQRRPVVNVSTRASPKCAASDPDQLKSAREDIKELLKSTFCHPILVRLGWHDAGTYNKNIEDWPQRGGANGSLRFEVELKHAANAGLVNALKLIQPIKDKYSGVTYADLFQLASATAIEEAGGPKIPMKYGRVDVSGPNECPEEGRLPDAGPPSPADHLRDVFYRMGLNDKEIVALSGAHTLGRSRPERSGWGKPETKKMGQEHQEDSPGQCNGWSLTIHTSRTSKQKGMKICLCCQLMLFFLKIPLSRYMLRNMLWIKRHSSRIMQKPMPNLATLGPNLTLQRVLC